MDPRQLKGTVTVMEVIFWEAPSAALCNRKNYDRLESEKKRRKGERPLQGIIRKSYLKIGKSILVIIKDRKDILFCQLIALVPNNIMKCDGQLKTISL